MYKKIIWLAGMPRSGTNWISQIFASCPDVRLKLCPLFSYEFKNEMNSGSTSAEWRDFFRRVYKTPSEYMDQIYLRKQGRNILPEFNDRHHSPHNLVIKSTRFHHLNEFIIQRNPGLFFVGIVRHPCAALHSWLDNPLEFPADCDPVHHWRSGACRKTSEEEFWGFEDWKRVASDFLEYEKNYPNRFVVLSYNQLVQNPKRVIKPIFERTGLAWTEQTGSFLIESQKRHCDHKRSVFKDKTVMNRWEQALSKDIAREILSEVRGTPMERFL
ncbi:sulfotransferase family protein [Desulfosarcina widdelii]|uniref:sulfotransferase family protein n=1 Tax=Desulfosarcina widdelii TaxID=947919 RepID=UPI0012D2B644|nr:sulfotransferase [Desulfosarcina widdelii]